ncbi:hypothetical protein M0Q28_06455 [Patescibacteria group bacterium]|nr:hypothetical protein [Patescibacteria group bacterium]
MALMILTIWDGWRHSLFCIGCRFLKFQRGNNLKEWASIDYGTSPDAPKERKHVHIDLENTKGISDMDRGDQAIKDAAEEIWQTVVEDIETWPEDSSPRIVLNAFRAMKVERDNFGIQLQREKDINLGIFDAQNYWHKIHDLLERQYGEIMEWVTQSFLEGTSVEPYQSMLNRHTVEYAAMRKHK